MTNNNSVLTAVSLLDNIITRTDTEGRRLLTVNELKAISRDIGLVLSNAQPLNMVSISEELGVVSIFADKLAENSLCEITSDAKDFIVDKLLAIRHNMLIEAGRYYMTHDFDYNRRLNPILNKICDEAAADGFYFGLDIKFSDQSNVYVIKEED